MIFLKKALLFFFITLLITTTVQADFGNWFVANKRLSNPLNTSDKKLSYRFTCQDDMNITAASVYCIEASHPPAYLVSLQEDEQGLPSGQPLTSSSYIPLSQNWSTIPLDSFPLIKGKVYHLVLEQDINRGGDHPVGLIGPSNYASFLSTDVLNHIHPNDGTPDPATNVLFFDGHHWKEMNQEPVYALYGAESQLQGNPYDDPGVCPIYGSGDPNDKSHQVLQGQAIHFHCGFLSSSFAIRVRKQGNPKSPLNYRILKNEFQIHKTYTIHSAVALNPDQVSPDFQWVTIGFDDSRASNFSPECWFLVFQTDSGKPSKNSPGCDDCYILSDVGNSGGLANAANLTFDGGPHLSRAIYSLDGGNPSHWMDAFERDDNVGALGPTCHITPYEDRSAPIPTPLPLDGDKGFQP
jgi:prepilin-type processing-associated H-X9-DG protein